jgi:ABC-type polysaccharide/polyol phosphate export permease
VPQMRSEQVVFFAIVSLLLGGGVILLRARLLRGRRRPDLLTSAFTLWKRRYLIQLWVTNNVRARYSQAVLGIVWVVLLPLAQAIIMAFVFSQFIRIPVGDVPFISFYMAALVPWGFLNNSVVQGAVSAVNNMELINQVYFPREILPLVKLGETAADALFTFAALVVINLVLGIPPNIYWVFLPLLALILFAGTFGLSLFLSVFTIYVRDVPQLAFVAMQLVFYLSPILYPAELIPERLRFIVMINPLVPIIQGFRDVLVFGRPVDIISLYYPIVFATALLYVGYSYFKAYERRFTDYI